jgi:hypothetical protein
MSSATLPLPLGIQRVSYGQRTDPPVSRFRLLVASAVLGVLVALGAIVFLAACEVVTRLVLTQFAGYQPGGPAGETVLFSLPWVDLRACGSSYQSPRWEGL